jgi:hypothetical protein
MTLRALAVWFLLLILAVLNGGSRDAWLSPRLGDTAGRAISSLLLSGLILLATWATIGWIRPNSSGQALRIGMFWVVLTLAFEFLVGHYGFGKSWPELVADYDVRRGRIWIVVLIATLLAPWMTARWRGLFGSP